MDSEQRKKAERRCDGNFDGIERRSNLVCYLCVYVVAQFENA